ARDLPRRSLAFLPALLFFAIAPPSWFRSFTASGPVRRRSTRTMRRILHDPCHGGRAPMWPKSCEIRGRPALRPRAPPGGTPDAARRSARGDAPRPPTGSRFRGGLIAGEVGALCATGGRRRRSGRPIPVSGLGLVAIDVTADVAVAKRRPEHQAEADEHAQHPESAAQHHRRP